MLQSNHFRQASRGGVYPALMAKSGKKPAEDGGSGIDPDRAAFGARLKAARNAAPRRDGSDPGYTQQEIADKFDVIKGTVSAWETGRGAPDAFTLRDLVTLYQVSADALLLERGPSAAAMKMALEYDQLQPGQREKADAMWQGFLAGQPPTEPTRPSRQLQRPGVIPTVTRRSQRKRLG